MSNETKSDGFVNTVIDMDAKKAGRFVVRGMILVILFGAIMMSSNSIAANASMWEDLEDEKNQNDLDDGLIGFQEHSEQDREISETSKMMVLQAAYILPLLRIGVSIGMLFVALGFMGFASLKEYNEKYRGVTMFIGGSILFLMMFTLFFNGAVIMVGSPFP